MPEGGAVGGIVVRSNTNFGQQNRIEGAKRDIARQENKDAADATAARNSNTGNRTIATPPEGVGTKDEGVRTDAGNNIQRQANNLNAANNVANTAQTERGQNINEVV